MQYDLLYREATECCRFGRRLEPTASRRKVTAGCGNQGQRCGPNLYPGDEKSLSAFRAGPITTYPNHAQGCLGILPV
jgi:hypothetical protein